jgi:hypothetical protein
VIANGHPQRIGVQTEQHQHRATCEHPKQLLGLKAIVERKPWDKHSQGFALP